MRSRFHPWNGFKCLIESVNDFIVKHTHLRLVIMSSVPSGEAKNLPVTWKIELTLPVYMISCMKYDILLLALDLIDASLLNDYLRIKN